MPKGKLKYLLQIIHFFENFGVLYKRTLKNVTYCFS